MSGTFLIQPSATIIPPRSEMSSETGMEKLRETYPWPDKRPNLKMVPWALDAGGRHLVVEQIQEKRLAIILEIGVFLGGSAKIWLDSSPNVVVIAVDSWQNWPGIGDFARKHHQPEWVAEQLLCDEEAFYRTFLSNLWDDRDRIIPMRSKALDALDELNKLGVKPDLVYLDSDKSGSELEICKKFFPKAILTGDDWFFGTDRFWRADAGYPIRKPVREFCQRHKKNLRIDRHTWVITEEPLSLNDFPTLVRYHLKCGRRRLRGAFRWLIRRDKAA